MARTMLRWSLDPYNQECQSRNWEVIPVQVKSICAWHNDLQITWMLEQVAGKKEAPSFHCR